MGALVTELFGCSVKTPGACVVSSVDLVKWKMFIWCLGIKYKRQHTALEKFGTSQKKTRRVLSENFFV